MHNSLNCLQACCLLDFTMMGRNVIKDADDDDESSESWPSSKL